MKPKVSVKQRNQRLDQTEVRLLEFFNNCTFLFILYFMTLILFLIQKEYLIYIESSQCAKQSSISIEFINGR